MSKETSKGAPEGWNEHKASSELEKLQQENFIKIYFEEKVDQQEGEDKYNIVVESLKVPGYKRQYSIKNIKNLAIDLLTSGHKVNSVDVARIIGIITDDFKEYTFEKYHTGIGWFKYQDKDAFRYNKVATSAGELVSEYRGHLDIKQKGNLRQYIQGIKELVVPYPKLFTVYVAGASGIVTQALKFPDTNIMLNIYGESGSGKTTAENVALSLWCRPEAQGFNTLNRTEELLAQRFIMPMTLDDMQSACSSSGKRARQQEILNHIFRFSTGKIKGRMRQTDSEFYGATLASSENPLLSKTLDAETTGQFYRMIELQVSKGELTKDVEHARRLENLIREHYGLGAYELGKYMVQQGYTGEKLQGLYERQHQGLLDDRRLEGYSRAANRLAVLTVTTTLINKCFNLNANIDDIKEVLFNAVVQSTQPLDKRAKAYDELEKIVNQSKEYFSNSQSAFKPGLHIGVFKKNVYGKDEVIIPTYYMEPLLHNVDIKQILAGSGDKEFRQPQAYELRNILNYWKSQGWLHCGGRGDQLYLKRKLGENTKQVLVYVVTFETNNNEEVDNQ